MAYKPEELCMQSKASMQDLALIVKELTNTDSAEELSVPDMADKLNVLTIRNVSNTGWEEILSPNPFTFTDICLEPKAGLTNLANIIRAKTGLAETDKLTVEQMRFLLDNWGDYRVVPVRFVAVGSDYQGASSYDITCTVDGMSETHTISFDIDGSCLIPFDNGITAHINSMSRSPYYWAYYGCDCGQDILNCDIDIPKDITTKVVISAVGDSGLSAGCEIEIGTIEIIQDLVTDTLFIEEPDTATDPTATIQRSMLIDPCPYKNLRLEVEELSQVSYRIEQTFNTSDATKNYIYSSSNYYPAYNQVGQLEASGFDEFNKQCWGLSLIDIKATTYDEESSSYGHLFFKYYIMSNQPVKLKIKILDDSDNEINLYSWSDDNVDKNIIKLGAI